MTAKVIQGSFLGSQSKLAALAQRKLIPPPLIQTKTVVRPPAPPAPAFAGRPPGPPAPAFAGRAGTVQRHGAGGAFAVETGPLGLASGGGRPLPEAVRGKMEAALRADFSNVRVHVGPQAERIGAIAFTIGSDIYFAPGRYQPDTLQGQQLLGHELAHVVQQRAGRVRNPLGSGLAVVQDHALEAEADRLGRHAAAHRIAAQAKMQSGAAPPPKPVRISPPISIGPGSYRLTAGTNGRQVGSIMVHARDRGAAEVTDLYVTEAQRGHGIGQMLVAAAAKTGLQSGRSKMTLAAQDLGSGHLTHWYKEMGFTQIGINRYGYPQLEVPISRVLAGAAQRREARQASADQLSSRKSAVARARKRTPYASPPRTAWENSPRALRQPQAVQRMELFKTFEKGAMHIATFGVGLMMCKPNPNPFEMKAFTFCVCLVFNFAGLEDYNSYKSGFGRVAIFESIKAAWESHHASGTFLDVCPFGEGDGLTDEYKELKEKLYFHPEIIGDHPLIVIVGHCSAGSSEISNDFSGEKHKGYDISKVVSSISPILKKRSTIYLTPCSSGVKGEGSSSDSFQTQLASELAASWVRPDLGKSEIVLIGTLSTSYPAMGGVYSKGETYSRVKIKENQKGKSGTISEDQFLVLTGETVISVPSTVEPVVGMRLKFKSGDVVEIVKVISHDNNGKTKCWVKKIS